MLPQHFKIFHGRRLVCQGRSQLIMPEPESIDRLLTGGDVGVIYRQLPELGLDTINRFCALLCIFEDSVR